MKLVLVSILFLLLSGCIYMSSYETPLYYRTSDVVIIKDTSRCEFLDKVEPKDRIWKENSNKDLIPLEVDRLKGMVIWQRGNAIANIKILSGIVPLGRGEAYKCSEAIFNEEIKKQQDKEYISKLIKIE